MSSLDREMTNFYNITIIAMDLGDYPGPLMTRSFLFITVLDVNDNTPNFSQQDYSFQVID